MSLGEALGLPVREKSGVCPAVVTHGQCTVPQEDDLHRVRMTALHADHVIMVAPVSRCGSARCHSPFSLISFLLHGPPLFVGLRVVGLRVFLQIRFTVWQLASRCFDLTLTPERPRIGALSNK
jgi:hypothetical protein